METQAIDKGMVFGRYVEKHVTELHSIEGKTPGKWSKNAGQWCVYGMEHVLGFQRGVELCATVESAWKKKQDISAAVKSLHTQWTVKQ